MIPRAWDSLLSRKGPCWHPICDGLVCDGVPLFAIYSWYGSLFGLERSLLQYIRIPAQSEFKPTIP